MPASPRNKKAFEIDVQGLRAVAIILVVLSHLPEPFKFKGGFIGVDIFFVISGYVISKNLLTLSSQRSSSARFRTFMASRVRRLAPALAISIIIVELMIPLFAPTNQLLDSSRSGAYASAFLSNIDFLIHFQSYWNPEITQNAFLHTWSLGVEFQNYIFLGALLIVMQCLGVKRKIPYIKMFLILLTISSLIGYMYFSTLSSSLNSQNVAFYNPLTRIWEMSLGFLVTVFSKPDHPRRQNEKYSFFLAIVFVISIIFIGDKSGTGLFVIIPVVSTAGYLFFRDKNKSSILTNKIMIRIGNISYSFYLYHWPLIVMSQWLYPGSVLAAVVAVVASLVLAQLSFSFIELPFRSRRKFIFGSTFASVAILIVALVVSLLVHGSMKTRVEATLAIPQTHELIPPTGNEIPADFYVTEQSHCTSTEQFIECANSGELLSQKMIVVIGDSLGYRLFPAVQHLAISNGYNAAMFWQGKCGIEIDSCDEVVYEYLRSHNVEKLVVAMNFDRASNVLNSVELATGEKAECPSNEAISKCKIHVNAVDKFEKDAAVGVKSLLQLSNEIYIALPFAQQASAPTSCNLSPRILTIFDSTSNPYIDGCGSTSLSWQIERQGIFPEALRSIVENSGDSVTIWDPNETLCQQSWCPTQTTEGEQFMSDGIHWTLEGSRFFVPQLKRILFE